MNFKAIRCFECFLLIIFNVYWEYVIVWLAHWFYVRLTIHFPYEALVITLSLKIDMLSWRTQALFMNKTFNWATTWWWWAQKVFSDRHENGMRLLLVKCRKLTCWALIDTWQVLWHLIWSKSKIFIVINKSIIAVFELFITLNDKFSRLVGRFTSFFLRWGLFLTLAPLQEILANHFTPLCLFFRLWFEGWIED